MRWLVVGAKGWIATHVTEYLECAQQTVLKVTEHVTSVAHAKTIIANAQPDRIVCCVGRTYGPGFTTIDYLEQKGKLVENLESNLMVPVWIAQATTIPILYFGTGCIYEFDELHTKENGIGFQESDKPNFSGSSYSAVKMTTDQIMGSFPHVINARIRMPISKDWHPRDFVTKIMGYSKITSIPNSMTVLDDIVPRLLALLYENKTGTINAVNPGYTDHETILTMFERSKYTYSLEPVELQNTRLLSRRSNNILSSGRLQTLCAQLQDETLSLFALERSIPTLNDSLRSVRDFRFSKTKHLLVTGGFGFIASNFINYWKQKYPSDVIVNVDRLDSCSNLKNIDRTDSSKYYEYVMDIQNNVKMLEILKRHDITHIVHFAAETHVDNSFGNPLSFTMSNVLGTHSLLEAAKAYGKIKCFFHMSTDEVYGEVPEGAANEESLLFPTNPYAATKAAAEYIVHSYGKSFKLPYMIMRANNIYGIHQYPEKVIPAFISSLLKGRQLRVQGDGSSKRMFLHVNDLITAIEAIFDRGVIGETYNIGTNEEYTVMQIAKLLIQRIKKTDDCSPFLEFVEDRPFNDSRYSINSDKVKSLGWTKKHSVDTSIDDIITWYTNNQEYWAH